MAGQPVIEGYIPFRGYRTWYRVVGEREAPGRLPLLLLHGGPGAGSDYLEPFEALAGAGRRVVLYDQLGCARSAVEAPHDPAMWTVELYVEEIDAVRAALGLERLHILGQSWGGMLAMEYALALRPFGGLRAQGERGDGGLASLVIESSPASMPQWVSEANRLRAALPPEVEATLLKHEAAGTTGDPEYEQAMMVFYRRHVIRQDPMPDCVLRTFANIARHPEVYNWMNGPSEFHVVGTLKDWNIIPRLGEIDVRTLVLSGRHDEATPEIAGTVHRGIRGSEQVVFEESSHMCHIEENERCLAVVADFLERVERGG